MTPLPTARARRLQAAPYTYDAVGATADGEEVPGFRSLPVSSRCATGLRSTIVQHHDRVVLRVSCFSRPGRLVTRLAGPAAPRLQVHVLARYARSLSH